MPDRIIRDELLESHRWLGLKDNADRVAFIALLLTVDDFGNTEAHPVRLLRLWRDYGIDTQAKVFKVLAELQDCDLIRIYEADGERYLHLPRFRQRLRYFKRSVPRSKWNQEFEEKKSDSSQTQVRLKSDEVKRSEEKRSKDWVQGEVSKRTHFVHPTLDQVQAYVSEKRLSVDPQRFVDHYTANGWKVGRNPMRDWQAACRTWNKMAVDKPMSDTEIMIRRGR